MVGTCLVGKWAWPVTASRGTSQCASLLLLLQTSAVRFKFITLYIYFFSSLILEKFNNTFAQQLPRAMRRGVRKVNSTYSRVEREDDEPSEPAPPSAKKGRSDSDSALLKDLASQMKTFYEGLTAASRMCEDTKSLLNEKLEETKVAIADGKAAALAESKATVAVLQRQIAQKSSKDDFNNLGNGAQYEWNCLILNIFTEALTCLECDDLIGARQHVRAGIKEIFTRNKHIKMADESPAGWGLVREYVKHSQAADEQDDAKIRRCETAALAKIKKRKTETTPRGKGVGKGRGKAPETVVSDAAKTPTLDPFTWALLQQSAQQYQLPGMPASFAPVTAHPKKLGPCYTCQGPHLQKDCAIYKAQNAAIQAHMAAAISAAPGNSK